MKIKLLLSSALLIIFTATISAQAPGSATKSTIGKTVVANKKANGKYNLVDSVSRSPVSEAEYDEAGKTDLGMIYLVNKERWGIAQKNGTVIINPDTSKYRYIDEKIDSAGNILAWYYDPKKKEGLGDMVLLNKQYRQITSRGYNFIMQFKQGFYQPYQKTSTKTGDLLFGLLNKEGKELLPPVYKLININNKDGLIIPWNSNGKYELYDITGKKILSEEYDRIEREKLVDNKYIEVTKGGLSGLIDKAGKIIIPIKYNSLSYFDYGVNSYFIAELDEKKGVLSRSGKVLLNIEYKEIFSEAEGGCLFFNCSKDGNKWGWIDFTGKTILPMIYSELVPCPGKEIYTPAKIADSSFVYVNKAGQLMPNKKFKYAFFFTDGLAPAKEKNKIGFLNTKGVYVVQPSFDELDIIYNFADYQLELYAVKKDGKWGFMDKKGQMVTGLIYDGPDEEYGSFGITEGLIAVSHNNKWGFINKSGKVVIPCTYDRVMRFSDGKAFVQLGSDKFHIDKNGERKK